MIYFYEPMVTINVATESFEISFTGPSAVTSVAAEKFSGTRQVATESMKIYFPLTFGGSTCRHGNGFSSDFYVAAESNQIIIPYLYHSEYQIFSTKYQIFYTSLIKYTYIHVNEG